MNKQDWISAKIKKLREEGRPQSQSVAIAYSMWEDKNKYQFGGLYNTLQANQVGNYQGFPYGDFAYTTPQEVPASQPRPQVSAANASQYTAGLVPNVFSPEQSLQQNVQPAIDATLNPQYRDQFVTPEPAYQDTINRRMYNPYTGVSMDNAFFTLGQSLGYEGDKSGLNTFRGIAAAGKIATGGLRSILSGMGYQNANQQAYAEYADRLYGATPAYSYFQQGGELTNAAVLTGGYAVETPQYNVEVENSEIIRLPDGTIQTAVGDTHENGGVKTQLPSGSKILSDYTKIGAQRAKMFKKEFDVKTKASDTFATVMDKVNKKLGYTELLEEEEKTINKVGEQQQSSIANATYDINMNFLSEKLQTIETDKQDIKPLQDEAFNKIFQEQEKIPKKNKDEKMQEGGDVELLAQKYNISPEKLSELLQQANPTPVTDVQLQVQQALSQGMTPEQAMQSLVNQGISQQQAMQVLQTAIPSMQNGGEVPKYQQAGAFYTPSTFALPQYANQPFGSASYLAGNVGTPDIAAQRILQQSQLLPNTLRRSGLLVEETPVIDNAEAIRSFQENYNKYVDSFVANVDLNTNLTDAQKENLKQQALNESFITEEGDVRSMDAILGNFTSSRGAFALPYLTRQDFEKYPDARRIGDIVDVEGNVKPEFKDLDPATVSSLKQAVQTSGEDALDIGLLPIETAQAQTTPAVQQPEVIQRQITELGMAALPQDFNLPPSPLRVPLLSDVTLGRMEAAKISPEANLIEADRQRQAAFNAIQYLPDNQKAAGVGTILGQTQATTNQAITQAEMFNAQAQQQADQFNIQQGDKQQILNEQFRQDYNAKTTAAIANTNRDLRDYFTTLNLQQRQNYADIRDLNLINQLYPHYQTTGTEVYFNNAPININATNPNTATFLASYNKLPQEEKWKVLAQMARQNKKV